MYFIIIIRLVRINVVKVGKEKILEELYFFP